MFLIKIHGSCFIVIKVAQYISKNTMTFCHILKINKFYLIVNLLTILTLRTDFDGIL